MNAAIYCRVSTEDQEKEGSSLQSQRDYCLRKALDLGYDVPDSCRFSETFTGATTDRPHLTELRRLIHDRAIDAVVCYSTDRLARNPIHIAIIAEECEKRGIDLIFVTEPLDRSPEGALIRYVKGYAAEMEREKIRERSIRGKKQKAKEGTLGNGGPRLFGYNVQDGRRIINPAEADLISRIFTWFAEDGYTLYRAVRDLNKEGIPGPAGGTWNEPTVSRLLSNPAYKGVTYAFRYTHRLTAKGKPVVKVAPKEQWIEVPGATPAIVSDETWEAAQEQIERNRHKWPVNKKHDYLFAGGRLRCGSCGHAMTGSVRKVRGKPWLYYRCITKVKRNFIYDACHQQSVSARKIEDIVWTNLLEVLDHPEWLLDEVRTRRDAGPTAADADEYIIHNNIQKAKEEEMRYLKLYGKGRIDERTFETLIEKVRENISALEKKRDNLKSKRESLELAAANADRLTTAARHFSTVLRNADLKLKLKALEAMDIKVTYTPDLQIIIDGIIPT